VVKFAKISILVMIMFISCSVVIYGVELQKREALYQDFMTRETFFRE